MYSEEMPEGVSEDGQMFSGGEPEQQDQQSEPVDASKEISVGEWVLWFTFATIIDLLSFIPVVGTILSVPGVWFFRFIFKRSKLGDKSRALTIVAIILSLIELDFTSFIAGFVPGCAGMVFAAWIKYHLLKKAKEKLARIEPIVSRFRGAAGKTGAGSRTKGFGGRAGSIGRSRGGVGGSTRQGGVSGQPEKSGSVSSSSDSSGRRAGGASQQAAGDRQMGVGKQYGADMGGMKTEPSSEIQARGIGAEEGSILEQVMANAEKDSPYVQMEKQTPYAGIDESGSRWHVGDGLAAIQPASGAKKKSKKKKLKPRQIPSQE